MKIKDENGIKWVSCDNLGELITEFKKFRAAQIASGQKKDYDDYLFFQMLSLKVTEVEGKKIATEEIDSAKVYQQDGVDLASNLSSLRFKEKDWSPYSKKVEKILREIWETGEVKDYQGLDLNWPATSHVCCDQCHKYIGDSKLAWISDREKDLDFCSEGCHSKFRGHDILEKENDRLKEQLKKETDNKTI